MCAGRALLPTLMRLELPGDTMDNIQGQGGYGVVSKCEYRGREVAVKALLSRRRLCSQELSKVRQYWQARILVCSMDPPYYSQRFWKEVMTWKAVQHPNILPLLGVAMPGDRLAMVSEWMTNGSIKKFIRAHPNANRYELVSSSPDLSCRRSSSLL